MSNQKLPRQLLPRHISMIAIGGSIGTGIFMASGNAIYTAGPGGALVAYCLIGLMVYFLMTSLGEMSALIPVTGTFCDYSHRFVDASFGFAMSYNYWFNWAITVAVELTSASILMQYWFPQVPFFMWSILFFSLVMLMNLFVVSVYGESEYWLSVIKVTAIIVFIAIGILMIVGVIGKHPIETHNWTVGDAPFHQGWSGLISVLLVAGFSFQGTEMFGVTAGEAKDPKHSIPRAMQSVFWRILIFYVASIAIISFVIPYNNPSLINADSQNVALSPFTIVFQKAGLRYAASIINAVILSAVLSACSASLYTATRLMWYMGQSGHASKQFAKINRQGVPVNALILTALVGCVAFASSFLGQGKLFLWLVNISSLSGFIAWVGIAISHYRFRKAYVAQGKNLKDLPYYSRFFPFSTLFALVLCVFIIVGQQLTTTSTHFNWGNLIGTYIGIPIFILLYLGHKIYSKSKLRLLKECDFEINSVG